MVEHAPDTNRVIVTVGSKKYTVNTTKMPYFTSHPSLNHDDIQHFDIALQCVEEGFHRAFRLLKADLSSYPILCETLKRLDVDVLGGQSLAEIIASFKHFSFDDAESKSVSTNLAEDSVFRLLYMHHTGILGARDRNKVFGGVMYISSHRYFFTHGTRSVVQETYKTMNPTAKQLAAIDKWPVYHEDGEPVEPFSECCDDYDSYSDPETEAYLRGWGLY